MTEYDTCKELMKTGDCLLFSSYSPIAAGIKMFTNSQWSHAALVIRLSEYEGEERHRFYIEATSPKVKLTRLTGKMLDYTGVIAWLPLPEMYDPFRQQLGYTMLQLLDKKYDYKSVLKQIFKKVSEDADAFFCSEMCGYVWNRSFSIGWTQGEALQPCDIVQLSMFQSTQLTIIYDGRRGSDKPAPDNC
jgi:hypothetical protein